MFFTKEKKQLVQLQHEVGILTLQVSAMHKILAEIVVGMREIKEAPHGIRKDGTPKAKPGRKVEP